MYYLRQGFPATTKHNSGAIPDPEHTLNFERLGNKPVASFFEKFGDGEIPDSLEAQGAPFVAVESEIGLAYTNMTCRLQISRCKPKFAYSGLI